MKSVTPIEIGLIATLVAIVAITALTSFGNPLGSKLDKDMAAAPRTVAECPPGSTYVPDWHLCLAGLSTPTYRTAP